MQPTEPPGDDLRPKNPWNARRIFGVSLVAALVGIGWSLHERPASRNSGATPARADDTRSVYAACQAGIRRSVPVPGQLSFPDEPESAESDGDKTLSLSSSVTTTAQLGTAYTQHFTCRATQAGGRGTEPKAWKVVRLAMDLPST